MTHRSAPPVEPTRSSACGAKNILTHGGGGGGGVGGIRYLLQILMNSYLDGDG